MTGPARATNSLLRQFIQSEAAGGIILMLVAAAALLVANSAAAPLYFRLLATDILGLSLLHWINDGFMAIFFLLIGLEVKREILEGQLSSWSRRALPGIAALGGMLVPALVYLVVTRSAPELRQGWAIPAATDIAFALGVLALLGPRLPVALKIFLTALAIIDDLGAVLIIALFYTGALAPLMLAAAVCLLALLCLLNRFGVARLSPYLLVGCFLWYVVLRSGIHATLAGVAIAFTIPLGGDPSPLHRLEHALQRLVGFLIVPIFGFANAGVSFSGATPSIILESLPLGIALGLFLGKQLGVFGFSFIAVRSGLARLPDRVGWSELYGVAVLTGIGFTMSLFIGTLAFGAAVETENSMKIGILIGSILSGATGFCLIRWQLGRRPGRSHIKKDG
jgi:NhaA family Na+:H+ antiporter